jgi:hypothetical protein
MKKVLSVDGGGIRGIIPLACLVQLEAQQGKPCHEIFDMVAGTSTGSIIAAGIAIGISARGILSLYKNLAIKAFQRLPWWEIIRNLGNHRYSAEFIAKTLDEIGANVPLNWLDIDVLITGKNTGSSRTDFFIRDKPSNASRWGGLPLRDAVLASIAAPTYFPPHTAQLNDQVFTWVDGGVGVAGNPCYHAAVEALHYSGEDYPPGDTQLYSFGTGRRPRRIEAKTANALDWLDWSLHELLEDVGEWQTYITEREYGLPGKIEFRRYQLDLASDVLNSIGIEPPEERILDTLGMDATWAVDLLERIGKSFAHQIDFTDPQGLVLETNLSV